MVRVVEIARDLLTINNTPPKNPLNLSLIS
jgi:hypothetical protein